MTSNINGQISKIATKFWKLEKLVTEIISSKHILHIIICMNGIKMI